MPNWACGAAAITGTKPNVVKFVNRFIHSDDVNVDSREERHFARSFTNGMKQDISNEIDAAFQGVPDDMTGTYNLSVDFAWSAYSCLIDGYPQNSPDHCITLDSACIEDQVSVEIITEEGGINFEELITCDAQGELVCDCKDLLPYKCRSCGSVMSLASFNDADEYSCYECGDVGLDPVEEDAELE